MKKVLLSILVFLLSPLMVKALDYDITNFYIESNIQENGDLEVNELIVLDGEFNGYERDILYKNSKLDGNTFENNYLYNAAGIENVEIKAKYVNKVTMDTLKDLDFDSFTKVPLASNGSKAKYIESSLYNGYRYRMYYPADDEKVAFYLKYTIKDAVVIHNDAAEAYWTFIPDGFEEEIKDIKIKVNLPAADNSNNFRLWAHGNLSGTIEKLEDSRGVYASINKVIPGESIDIRLTFDKNLVSKSTKKSNVDALDGIIKVEEERAEIANNLRYSLLKKYNTSKYLTITLYILITVLFVFTYFKYGKSPKSSYYSKYNREFIDDYNVEVIDYLMNRTITPNAMSASIMNLIYKKNISVEEIKDSKNDKKKDYTFTLLNEDNLSENEKILINFLFTKVGSNNTFTTKDLKKYANGTKTCDKFINSYTAWKNKTKEISEKEGFFTSSSTPKIIGCIILILSFMIFIYSLSIETDFIPAYLIIVYSIIFFIYSLTVYKKTEKGSLHYDKWSAFKNFLNDFGSFELKELPEIILWERYLVYATVFGLAKKVQKSMNVYINEIDMEAYPDYYPMFLYLNIGDAINTSFNNALTNAYSMQAANYSNSHSSSSSGSGFGGGFSSGGGFGGGGGGGRGF